MPSETQGFRRHFLSGLEGVLSVVRFVGQVNVEAGAFACVLVGGGLPCKQSAEAGAFDDDAFFCSLSGGMEEDGLILRLADEPVEVGHFFILFLVLGLGVFGFVFKELLIKFLVLPK